MHAANIKCGGVASGPVLRRSSSAPTPYPSARPSRCHVQVHAACQPHRYTCTNVLAATIPECSMASYVTGQQARSSVALTSSLRTARCASGGSRRRPTVVVSASWGAPVEFKPAAVVSSKPAAEGLYTIALDVSVDIASGYAKPGQYIQVKVGESKPGFFAISSPPDVNNAGVLQLLIKKTGNAEAAADLLIGAGPGATNVSVSPVQGKGFPVDRTPAAEFPSVLLFATGSGISPVKALIESDALKAAGRSIRLYYGARSPATAAFSDLLGAWKTQHGVDVVTVYSQDGHGYVQDAFKRDLEAGKVPGLPAAAGAGPAKVAVVLCGQKGMCQAVTDLAKENGVEADKVLLNF